MSGHIHKLSGLCRLCGKSFRDKRNFPIIAYIDEINHIYKINTRNDLKDVHPERICHGCRGLLFRFRKMKTTKSSGTLTVPELYPFSPHSSGGDCKLCDRKKGENVNVILRKLSFDFSQEHVTVSKKMKLNDSSTDTANSDSDTVESNLTNKSGYEVNVENEIDLQLPIQDQSKSIASTCKSHEKK